MGIAQACLERILEIDPAHFYGAPYVLMGTILAARPGLAGGDAEKARMYFEKAIELSQGRFYFAQYHYAKYYAVRVQNKKLFLRLIQEVMGSQPDQLAAVCLINTVMKQKAKKLLAMSEDLFF
jgi:tetratricopeptide (TPR) repeat protein